MMASGCARLRRVTVAKAEIRSLPSRALARNKASRVRAWLAPLGCGRLASWISAGPSREGDSAIPCFPAKAKCLLIEVLERAHHGDPDAPSLMFVASYDGFDDLLHQIEREGGLPALKLHGQLPSRQLEQTIDGLGHGRGAHVEPRLGHPTARHLAVLAGLATAQCHHEDGQRR